MREFPVASLLCLAAVTLNGCQKDPAAMYPTLHVDSAHNHAIATATAKYTVPPTPGVVLGSTGYVIQGPPKSKHSQPNAVHLVVGPKAYFRVPWNGQGQITLDASSLVAVMDPMPFPGFVAGKEYVLAVGYDNYPPGDSKLQFEVMWASLVTVE